MPFSKIVLVQKVSMNTVYDFENIPQFSYGKSGNIYEPLLA